MPPSRSTSLGVSPIAHCRNTVSNIGRAVLLVVIGGAAGLSFTSRIGYFFGPQSPSRNASSPIKSGDTPQPAESGDRLRALSPPPPTRDGGYIGDGSHIVTAEHDDTMGQSFRLDHHRVVAGQSIFFFGRADRM